jgi:hypothetical protein
MNTCPFTIHFKIIKACSKVFVECNASKLFSPYTDLSNGSDQITNTELWLERIFLRFQYTEEESDMCRGELLEITETLQHECENKMIVGAWCIAVAIWNGKRVGLNLCNFGRELYSFHQV